MHLTSIIILFFSLNGLAEDPGHGEPALNYRRLTVGGKLSKDAVAFLMDQVVYGAEANQDQSLTRNPQGSDSAMVQHLSLPEAMGKRFSPGVLLSVPENSFHPISTPEAPTVLMMGWALAGMLPWKLRSRSFPNRPRSA